MRTEKIDMQKESYNVALHMSGRYLRRIENLLSVIGNDTAYMQFSENNSKKLWVFDTILSKLDDICEEAESVLVFQGIVSKENFPENSKLNPQSDVDDLDD